MLFLLISCSDSGKNVQDLYDEQVILAKLLEPVPNPKGRCETMLAKAGECISQANDKSTQLLQFLGNSTEKYTVFIYTPEYVSKINDTSFLLTFDQSKLTNAEYCSQAVNAVALNRASDAFKECLYTCQRENYTTFQSAGACSTKSTQSLILESNGSGQNLCAIKCGKVTNN